MPKRTRNSRSENALKKRGVNHGTPFSQRWIYDFYYHFEDQLLSGQKSIINKVLEGMQGEDAHISESTATKRQKASAVKIIHRVLARADRRISSKPSKKKNG